MTKSNVTIAGSGYVGMSIATLLAKKNNVKILDIDEEKVNKVNVNKSTIPDVDIENYLKDKNISITATIDNIEAYSEADFVIVCTPTNYDEKTNYFNTTSVEEVINNVLAINKRALIVIKSTIPLGFTDRIRKKYNTTNIVFSPEFLREGRALHDNLYPSRIIVGNEHSKSHEFIKIMHDSALKKNTNVLSIPSRDAEAIKLFFKYIFSYESKLFQ